MPGEASGASGGGPVGRPGCLVKRPGGPGAASRGPGGLSVCMSGGVKGSGCDSRDDFVVQFISQMVYKGSQIH